MLRSALFLIQFVRTSKSGFRAAAAANPPLLPCTQVVALNESVPGSVKSVFKPWEQRLDTAGVCMRHAVSPPRLSLALIL
jgi:hypothetical protein